jgi:cell wall-associated NlpC family hydrolase
MTTSFDRRTTPARPDLAAESLRGQIDASRYVKGQPMRVVDEYVSLRGSPRRDTPVDTQALFGERVCIYEIDEEGWAWGQLQGDSYVGYMPAEALRNDVRAATHRVKATRTFVYPTPDMKSPVVMALPMAAEVCIVAARDAFAQVAGLGFVWADHLAPIDFCESDFVGVAEKFINVPYLWGGKTFEGLDCSGLVQVSLRMCGIQSPRDTDMMAAALGEEMPLRDDLTGLHRGDLVFWKGHIGVMRDETNLLHANGHHMSVASEPLTQARERILAKSFGAITCVRRLAE